MEQNIVKYVNGELEIDVKLDEKDITVLLSANQMALLFERDEKTIRKHINNVFKENELDQENNTQKMRVVGVKQPVPFYTLDVIISVGYRVKSKRGVAFRQWANNILKQYMLKGYVVNEKRLQVLNKTVKIQSNIIAGMAGIEADEVYKVVTEYAEALLLLDSYDHQCIKKPDGHNDIAEFTYEDCKRIIRNMEYSKYSEVFGVEKEKGKVNGIIATVYQEVFGKKLYPTMEEKAANLLYFMIKDHPYADGCKRIAAAVFLEFLNKNNALYRNNEKVISESALVAITLMIAESKPEEKQTMIELVMNFIIM